MASPNNILRAVATYQLSGLAKLLNTCCYVSGIANTKFNDFYNIEANLGSTVTYNRPARFLSTNSLVWADQPSVTRQLNLTVNNQGSVSTAYTAQDRIFNVDHDVEHFMKVFGDAAIAELANAVEISLQLQNISGTTGTDNNGNILPPDFTSGPYRFFGNGVTQINSYTQLARMLTNFKDFGAVKEGIKVILPTTAIPSIVGTGLNQFAPIRNNEIAMSWEIGEFGTPPVRYYESNLLPTQVAGTVGNSSQTLTLVSTNDPTGQNVTQLTFSGATANDTNAIAYGDLLQFSDGVSGKPNLRFLHFIGHSPSQQPVQFRANAQAAADGSGNVVISITPALVWAPTANQNLNVPLQAGMQATALPSHIAGLVVGGDSFFASFPKLPDLNPFDSSSVYDKDTGVSLQFAFGAVIGQNITRYGYNIIWGSSIDPDYCMRIAFPLNIT